MNKSSLLLGVILILCLITGAFTSCQQAKIEGKLSGHLIQLIEAEKRGEAEEWLRLHPYTELINGDSVTVTIECEDDMREAVAEKAEEYGIVEVSILDLVQMIVPINNIKKLARIPGVHFVRFPWYAEEE